MANKISIATSKEQSLRLVSSGVNPATADMVWTSWENDDEEIVQLSVLDEYAYEASSLHPVEAWSLSALLSLLPETIIRGNTVYYLDLAPYDHKHWKWGLGYFSTEGIRTVRMLSRAADPIEVCVEAIVWLLENGYKLNEISK